jgi:hypothetical protein
MTPTDVQNATLILDLVDEPDPTGRSIRSAVRTLWTSGAVLRCGESPQQTCRSPRRSGGFPFGDQGSPVPPLA